MAAWLQETSGGLVLNVRVIPRASKTTIQGEHGDALKIRLCAPPVDGAANTALIQYLAKQLGISKANVALLSGATSRQKRIQITGLSADAVRHTLSAEIK